MDPKEQERHEQHDKQQYMKIKTAQKLSFECSHSGVSSTDLKLKLKT